MISLILPYWNRQAATERSLALMAEHYASLDLEIIVVDDGSLISFIPPDSPFKVRVLYLKQKVVPLNPCVPFNRGVAAAAGDVIALSNPEMLHNVPILPAMLEELKDPLDYVMAAAWSVEQNKWHCHSTKTNVDIPAYIPPGSNFHFMSMMHRSLWDKTGGFDEDYRGGAGYDDPDFVRRLHRAGANFIMRDDLVVEHPRAEAHADWTPEMFKRNRFIFLRKWRPL